LAAHSPAISGQAFDVNSLPPVLTRPLSRL
jgi:hypothetical protein